MTTPKDDKTASAKEMLSNLSQLVDALDRRVPRLEQLGEGQIARDAADLRERAVNLIREIEALSEKPKKP